MAVVRPGRRRHVGVPASAVHYAELHDRSILPVYKPEVGMTNGESRSYVSSRD